jgi:phosphonate transport system ATP-binding protein
MNNSPGVAVRVSAIGKTFGTRQALKNIDLEVREGERVALLGASGSGKSTLLRCLCALEVIDGGNGRVELFGRTLQGGGRLAPELRQMRRQVGIVFQQFNLVGRLPVLANVLTGLASEVPLGRSLLGRFTLHERARALDALASMGLEPQAFQRASTLSGGQQQRAAIARAMEQRARIILADEPIASLDPETARLVMDCLTALNRHDGVTVLVSLHQVQFALQYCPRSIAMKDGRLVYDGPSADLTPTALRNIYGLKSTDFDLDGTTPLNFGVCPPVPALAAGS